MGRGGQAKTNKYPPFQVVVSSPFLYHEAIFTLFSCIPVGNAASLLLLLCPPSAQSTRVRNLSKHEHLTWALWVIYLSSLSISEHLWASLSTLSTSLERHEQSWSTLNKSLEQFGLATAGWSQTYDTACNFSSGVRNQKTEGPKFTANFCGVAQNEQ